MGTFHNLERSIIKQITRLTTLKNFPILRKFLVAHNFRLVWLLIRPLDALNFLRLNTQIGDSRIKMAAPSTQESENTSQLQIHPYSLCLTPDQVLDRHTIFWDVQHNRPVQPGNVIVNPHTGTTEPISSQGCTIGPPAIDFFVHNITLPPLEISPNPFRGLRTELISTLDEVLASLGKHIADGEYQVMSLNASRYSVVLIIRSMRDHRELDDLFKVMKTTLASRLAERSRAIARDMGKPETEGI